MADDQQQDYNVQLETLQQDAIFSSILSEQYKLTPEAIAKLLEAVSHKLPEYDVSIPLTVWAYDIVSSLLDNATILECLFTHYRQLVRGAIYGLLSQNLDLGLRDDVSGAPDSYAIETAIDEIESEVWMKVSESVETWKPCPNHTAVVSTRLTALADAYAFYWTQAQLRERERVDYAEWEEAVAKNLYDNPPTHKQFIFDPDEVTKECSACKAILSLIEFHKLRWSKDGRQNTCKSCRKEARPNYK